MHEVLVNRLGGLSLPRKSVVRLTDRPDMTLDVYRGRKTTMQQQVMPSIFAPPPSFLTQNVGSLRAPFIFSTVFGQLKRYKSCNSLKNQSGKTTITNNKK